MVINIWYLQVRLACSLKKPLFVHEREAHDALLNILKRYQQDLPIVVIHSFAGNSEEAISYLALGCYIGITGKYNFFSDGVRFSKLFFL